MIPELGYFLLGIFCGTVFTFVLMVLVGLIDTDGWDELG